MSTKELQAGCEPAPTESYVGGHHAWRFLWLQSRGAPHFAGATDDSCPSGGLGSQGLGAHRSPHCWGFVIEDEARSSVR
jgi:hypothetical protein